MGTEWPGMVAILVALWAGLLMFLGNEMFCVTEALCSRLLLNLMFWSDGMCLLHLRENVEKSPHYFMNGWSACSIHCTFFHLR